MKAKLRNAVIAAAEFLLSPQARRLEIALAFGVYEAIRAALGSA